VRIALPGQDRSINEIGSTHMTVTLITGANKGLGYETARRLIAEGHTVYVGSRDVERGEKAATALGARFVQLDVTDDSSVAAALASIDEREGLLDVLVNNAGISPIVDVSGPIASDIFDTNVIGVIRVTQAALPLLRQSANPVVVNVSSALGSFWAVTNPERRQFHFPSIMYGASKAAVSMLTVQYAKSFPEIKFNAVEPGFTATELTPFSGAGQPVEDGAEVIVRMASIGTDGPTGTFWEGDEQLGW
jgi:NAD(P)-dependent dehydrogenase (short-subunit alcohol dehydrogenase family)